MKGSPEFSNLLQNLPHSIFLLMRMREVMELVMMVCRVSMEISFMRISNLQVQVGTKWL